MTSRLTKKQRMAARKRERDAVLRLQRRNEVREDQNETKRQQKLRQLREEEEARIAARRAEHMVVDGKKWIMADASVGRATELCAKLKEADIPHFRATEEQERISPSGRKQVVKVPVVARTIFIGVEHQAHLSVLAAKFPWLNEKRPQQPYGRGIQGEEFPWMVDRVHKRQTRDKEGYEVLAPALLPEKQVKDFANTVIGLKPIKAPDDSIKPGESVRVEDGPFATFPGTVKAIDEETGDLIVDVSVFGRLTPVHLHPKQVSRIDDRRAA